MRGKYLVKQDRQKKNHLQCQWMWNRNYFVLVGEKYSKYKREVKVIPWLVVVDLDKKVLKKIVRKKRIIRKIRKLNENRTRVKFEKRVNTLMSTDAPDL